MTESSLRTDPMLRAALRLAQPVVETRPSGLLTDFDGTLSTIVDDPETASLADGAGEALEALSRSLSVVAVITGRAAMDARRRIGIRGLLIVGNHGVEWLDPDAESPSSGPGAQAAALRIDEAVGSLHLPRGVWVEHKGLSATIHYRTAGDPEAARAAIMAALASSAPGGGDLVVREGRMSVELRPRGLGDKGRAAHAVVERYGLRGVVAMGDDVTDLDMFAAVASLRASGRIRGAIVAVGGAGREVQADVSAAADVTLADPQSAAAFLAELAAAAGLHGPEGHPVSE